MVISIDAIAEWVKQFWGFLAALIGIGGAVYKYIVLPIVKRRKKEKKERSELLREIRNKIDGIETEMKELGKDVGYLQHDRLQQGHDHFMKLGYCPPGDKENLIDMYDRYISRGRNSLYKNYKKELLDLPPDPNTHWGAR